MISVLLLDESVKYQTLPAVHLRHVISPTSITTTVGHEVDIEGLYKTDSINVSLHKCKTCIIIFC